MRHQIPTSNAMRCRAEWNGMGTIVSASESSVSKHFQNIQRKPVTNIRRVKEEEKRFSALTTKLIYQILIK